MDELSMAIGKRIRELRKAKGLRQRALSRKIGQASNVVCHWEHGDYCPGAYWLIQLADCLECSVDEILGRTSNEYS